MHNVIVAIGLIVVIAAIVTLARRTGYPYPILLVISGLILGLIPGIPELRLEPESVFLILLPPLLYGAAWQTNLRDFRANLRSISLLALGLVFTTTLVIGFVAHMFIDGMSWGVAFVFGAVVSSTDSVAATAIFQRLGISRRVVAIVEGESLVNDASALVAYRFAVAAVSTGTFVWWRAGTQFLLVSVGGAAMGLGIGWASAWLWNKLDDPPVEILMSIVPAYVAYLAADTLGVSGVLATVVAGVYVSHRSAEIVSSRARIQAYAVWELMQFTLNGIVFLLIGLQLRNIVQAIPGEAVGGFVRDAVIVSAAVILVRILWVFPATYLPRWLLGSLRRRDPSPPWQYPAILSWAGMRGVVALASAVALPLTISNGAPFPERDRIIFLTFAVILATLVLQGLTLAPLIRWLKIEQDHGAELETARAELQVAQAALVRLDELASEDWVLPEKLARLRTEYEFRVQRLQARCTDDETRDEYATHTESFRRLQQELLYSERHEAIAMRNTGTISDEVLRRVEHELDLSELRLAEIE